MDNRSPSRARAQRMAMTAVAAMLAVVVVGPAAAGKLSYTVDPQHLTQVERGRGWAMGEAQQRVYVAETGLKGGEVAEDTAIRELESAQMAQEIARGDYKEAVAGEKETRKGGNPTSIDKARRAAERSKAEYNIAKARVRWAKQQLKARKALVKQLGKEMDLARAELELARVEMLVENEAPSSNKYTVSAFRNQVANFQDEADEASYRTRQSEHKERIARVYLEDQLASVKL